MIFPELQSDRLVIDEIIVTDSNAIFELFSSVEVTKYYDLAIFTKIEQAEKIIKLFRSRFEAALGIRWAIRLKENAKCIGTCGFNSWNTAMQSATIGYDLNYQFWGRGIITEALLKIIQTAFDGQLACGNLNRIQADTVPGNFASEAVLAKLGFVEEGLRRQSGYWKNAFHDLKCFGLLKDDFQCDKALNISS